MFSTLPKPNSNLLAKFNLSYANTFNLEQSKNVLFGKELITCPNLVQIPSMIIEIHYFNPLPNDKFETRPNSNTLQTTILNLTKMAESSSMGRKHGGKRRNCSSRAISPFPTVFSKDLYCRHVKTRACLGKV